MRFEVEDGCQAGGLRVAAVSADAVLARQLNLQVLAEPAQGVELQPSQRGRTRKRPARLLADVDVEEAGAGPVFCMSQVEVERVMGELPDDS